MTALKGLNLATRFGLELVLLVSLTAYCWRMLPPGIVRLATTIAAPLVVMVVWASVVHGTGVPGPVRVATQVALFALAVLALAAVRRPELALAFGGVAVANAALMAVWHQ